MPAFYWAMPRPRSFLRHQVRLVLRLFSVGSVPHPPSITLLLAPLTSAPVRRVRQSAQPTSPKYPTSHCPRKPSKIPRASHTGRVFALRFWTPNFHPTTLTPRSYSAGLPLGPSLFQRVEHPRSQPLPPPPFPPFQASVISSLILSIAWALASPQACPPSATFPAVTTFRSRLPLRATATLRAQHTYIFLSLPSHYLLLLASQQHCLVGRSEPRSGHPRLSFETSSTAAQARSAGRIQQRLTASGIQPFALPGKRGTSGSLIHNRLSGRRGFHLPGLVRDSVSPLASRKRERWRELTTAHGRITQAQRHVASAPATPALLAPDTIKTPRPSALFLARLTGVGEPICRLGHRQRLPPYDATAAVQMELVRADTKERAPWQEKAAGWPAPGLRVPLFQRSANGRHIPTPMVVRRS